MKLLTPSIKDCRYIHRKLKQFYKENEYVDEEDPLDTKEFDRAINRFCEFYNISLPKIEWYVKIDDENTLGLCHEDGTIWFLTPFTHIYGEYDWIDTVYHELAHYIMWANAEQKAEAFANRMMVKWRK